MSRKSSKKSSTTIKIAAKEVDKRTSVGGADPGPGDLSAEPSSMPVPVDIPSPPTPSELVVKSTATSKKTASSATFQTLKEASRTKSKTPSPSVAVSPGSSGSSGSGTVQDVDEVGEGEVGEGTSPTASPQPEPSQTAQTEPQSGGSASKPQGETLSKATSVTSNKSITKQKSGSSTVSPTVTKVPSAEKASAKQTKPPSKVDESPKMKSFSKDGKRKKVTKFRYHKRVSVRTKGKANPSTVMSKVNKDDKGTAITASNIDDIDPSEIMKRAGINNTKKAHWRVRLRQTKRIVKDGKTITQTKVAYRDSEGNKKTRTSSSPFCKKCGQKLEDCKCENVVDD